MEGKAVLFKRFSDIDGIDLEVNTEDVDAFCQAVKLIAPSFGGINLEDIKAPESFMIEERLVEECDIPVMHDDQHGTAIIAAAGLLNALHLTGRDLSAVRLVVNGAGAAALSCVGLLKDMGLPAGNVILCDSKGVVHAGRSDLNQWKSAHAIETDLRTLEDAMKGADAFFGLSVKDAVNQDMIRSMADKPIIFAMANPDPEILPEDVRAVRGDAIIATGRSDYPNQVNNVLGFPYIFRGALDVRATRINQQMKVAAARALAALAREDVPGEVGAAYGRSLAYGPDYIIPAPFDPRLISTIPARWQRPPWPLALPVNRSLIWPLMNKCWRGGLTSHAAIQAIYDSGQGKNLTFVFAEGEDERAMRAGANLIANNLGQVKLIGRTDAIEAAAKQAGINLSQFEVVNAALTTEQNDAYADALYNRMNRKGLLRRDAQRLVNTDRNVYAAAMLAAGQADVMLTGLTRSFKQALKPSI